MFLSLTPTRDVVAHTTLTPSTYIPLKKAIITAPHLPVSRRILYHIPTHLLPDYLRTAFTERRHAFVDAINLETVYFFLEHEFVPIAAPEKLVLAQTEPRPVEDYEV